MNYVELVAVLAVLQLVFFFVLVGRTRAAYGAPAVSGHEQFERMYRVQMNTLEQLAAFLPAFFLAGKYRPNALVAGAGLVYLIGRLVYWRAYLAAPDSRKPGFVLPALPTLGLLLAGFLGAACASCSRPG